MKLRPQQAASAQRFTPQCVALMARHILMIALLSARGLDLPVLVSVPATTVSAPLYMTRCVALTTRHTQIHALLGARVLVLPVLVNVHALTVYASLCLPQYVAPMAGLTPTNVRQYAPGLRQLV